MLAARRASASLVRNAASAAAALRRATSAPSKASPSPPASAYKLIEALGLDLGGTLSKMVVYVPDPDAHPELSRNVRNIVQTWRRSHLLSFVEREPKLGLKTRTGRLGFARFLTSDMSRFIEGLCELRRIGEASGIPLGDSMVCVTGGGAHRFRAQFAAMGVALEPRDEMESLASGFRYLVKNDHSQAYHAPGAKAPAAAASASLPTDPSTPVVVANIGSGVSVLVGAGQRFQRVTGSSIGGSTFLGLVRRMTSFNGFDEAVVAAERGDRTTTSMLVQDIYGTDYSRLGLAGTLVASDFGKLATAADPKSAALDADIARGAMVLVLNNVAQLAVSTAQKHNASRIYFVGGMLRSGLMEELLTTGVEFWSGGALTATFLRHTGYLGTVGSLLANRQLSKELAGKLTQTTEDK